jgi:hypothetical protein
MTSDRELDPCGCCEPSPMPEPVHNPPGLPALRYRVGTHARFLARMLEALPLTRPGDGQSAPLAGLTARTGDDATVAFLDAAASVADVLTFYQERIANEGFLRTATERRSVLELARAIGYELAPGVAANAWLAFTVEDAPGAPGRARVAGGTPLQSVPAEGQLPQVFETMAELDARAEWNVLRPRRTRPADLAIRVADDQRRLVLLGPSGSFPAGTEGLETNVPDTELFRLDPGQAPEGPVDALEVGFVYLTAAAADLQKGDLILLSGKRDEAVETLLQRVAAATPEPESKRVRVELEPLPATPSTGARRIPYRLRSFAEFARPRLLPIAFDGQSVQSRIVARTWRERELGAFLRIQRWQPASLLRAIRRGPPRAPVALEAGAFTFRERLGCFGHNAPKWGSLPKPESTRGNPYPNGWDAGDTNNVGTLPRSVWVDSQGGSLANADLYLERPVAGLVRASWIVLLSPGSQPAVYGLAESRDESRADYGLSGRAAALVLAAPGGGAPTKPALPVRTTAVHANSQRLEPAELPIDAPLDADRSIELDRMVLGLAVGRTIVLTGERTDTPGVVATEVGFVADVVHRGGHTTLVLRDPLAFAYVRDTVTIHANVVAGTHGETVREVLGSGDASIANQTFALQKPPLTHVSTPDGAGSTLEVRIDGVSWPQVASLWELGPHDRGYVVRIDDDARARVTFGDGRHGARLPTGSLNVTATYRSGIGAAGEVDADSLTLLRALPLGIRGVTNPLPAGGAADPEQLGDARRNAPRTVLTFDRVVSLTDCEDFARTYPGIGKARADVLWKGGAELVHLTVAGATGKAPDGTVLANLVSALADKSDGSLRLLVNPFAQRYFTVKAKVAVAADRHAPDVLAATATALRRAFAFDTRDFAQSVTAAEVMQLVHAVPGVVAVDVDELLPYHDEDEGPPPTGPTLQVPAHRARRDADGAIQPAELLLVNPVGIELEEMPR